MLEVVVFIFLLIGVFYTIIKFSPSNKYEDYCQLHYGNNSHYVYARSQFTNDYDICIIEDNGNKTAKII